MTNNLQSLRKDLKGFAKKCKNFKYILFHNHFPPNFKLILHVTREKDAKESTNKNNKDNQIDSKFIKGRFNLEKYLKDKTLDVTSDFILCGHINFVKDIYNDLLKCKVPVEQISTEIFFES